jgi:hypothetical protein
MDERKWSAVDSKNYYYGIPGSGATRITTERIRVHGTRIWIYRDIIEVYEHLNWVLKDIKYVTVKEDESVLH